jgi:hypothetical protein
MGKVLGKVTYRLSTLGRLNDFENPPERGFAELGCGQENPA